ncbi:MAG TPA: hypothetical protein VLF68_01035 [Candidatus Saccharimonadales bacterium]|nr:hypothetical protein [Candidatus Saccharimonadales bacterium]
MKQKAVLFDIDYTLFDTGAFKQTGLTQFGLYEEVLEVLQSLQKDAVLGIFSEGDIAFQEQKLHKTDIHSRFLKEHMHIVTKKTETISEILKKYKDYFVFLVDDKLEILHLAKQKMPALFTIWVKRGIFAQNQKPINGFKADAQVSNLRDIITIIEGQK